MRSVLQQMGADETLIESIVQQIKEAEEQAQFMERLVTDYQQLGENALRERLAEAGADEAQIDAIVQQIKDALGEDD